MEAKQLDDGIGNTFVSVGVTSVLCIVVPRVPSSLFTIPHHPSRTEDDAIFPAGYRHVVSVQDDADQMEAAHKIDDLRHTLFAARSKSAGIFIRLSSFQVSVTESALETGS